MHHDSKTQKYGGKATGTDPSAPADEIIIEATPAAISVNGIEPADPVPRTGTDTGLFQTNEKNVKELEEIINAIHNKESEVDSLNLGDGRGSGGSRGASSMLVVGICLVVSAIAYMVA